MIRSLTLFAFVSLTACAGAGTTPGGGGSAKERLALAIENNGCVFNQANALKVSQEANVGLDEIPDLINTLQGEGRAEQASGASIRILSDNCI